MFVGHSCFCVLILSNVHLLFSTNQIGANFIVISITFYGVRHHTCDGIFIPKNGKGIYHFLELIEISTMNPKKTPYKILNI